MIYIDGVGRRYVGAVEKRYIEAVGIICIGSGTETYWDSGKEICRGEEIYCGSWKEIYWGSENYIYREVGLRHIGTVGSRYIAEQ
jgi:hypothetical protein